MRWAIGIGTSLLILWLAYAVWPFFTVYRLADAVQARNVAAVSELVDFPALRRSLTIQIVRTYLRLTGTAVRGSILEQFSLGVGASVADPIVAKLIYQRLCLNFYTTAGYRMLFRITFRRSKASARRRLATFGAFT
jgi:hypothetical protein